jgi:hypothetical protein
MIFTLNFDGDYDESVVDDVVSFVKSVRLTKKKKPLNFSSRPKEIFINVRKENMELLQVCDSALYLESTEVDHRIESRRWLRCFRKWSNYSSDM